MAVCLGPCFRDRCSANMGLAGYRSSPFSLGRLDDLLGIGLPIPLTASTSAEQPPASAAVTVASVNGRDRVDGFPMPPPTAMDVDSAPPRALSVVSMSAATAANVATETRSQRSLISADAPRRDDSATSVPTRAAAINVAASPSAAAIPTIAPQAIT